MNRRRVIEHAKGYLEQLSRGIDPISGQAIGPDTMAEPRLQRCFAYVSELLGELLENDGYVALPGEVQYELVRKKTAFQLSPEQRRKVYIPGEPVTTNTFVSHVNRVIDSGTMEKLSVKWINEWLICNGYLSQTKQPTVINRTVMRPLQRAADIGIREAETTDPKTGEIKSRLMLTPRAQRFLLDNLDSILEAHSEEESP